MRNCGLAIVLSVAVHLALAAGLVAYFSYAPAPRLAAELDLSSVELSFAEVVDEAASPVPASPATPEPPTPKLAEPPRPEFERIPASARPDPEALKFPEPEPERRLEPPAVVRSESAPVQPAAPRQAKVDAPPKPRREIRPDYPRGARQRGEQGEVRLELRVDERGLVESVEVIGSTGFPELDQAAVKAVRAARFTPARSGNEAVASTVRLSLTFRLR